MPFWSSRVKSNHCAEEYNTNCTSDHDRVFAQFSMAEPSKLHVKKVFVTTSQLQNSRMLNWKL